MTAISSKELEDKISNLKDEIKELSEQLDILNEILFDPERYREAYKMNTENELFEDMKKSVFQYVKEKSSFRNFLFEELGDDLIIEYISNNPDLKQKITKQFVPEERSAPRYSIKRNSTQSSNGFPRSSTNFRGSSRAFLV